LHHDLSPFAAARRDAQRSAGDARTLAHAFDAVPFRRNAADVESDAIIFDGQRRVFYFAGERHADALGPRMLADVGERLLGDAIQLGFNRKRESAVAARLEGDANS